MSVSHWPLRNCRRPQLPLEMQPGVRAVMACGRAFVLVEIHQHDGADVAGAMAGAQADDEVVGPRDVLGLVEHGRRGDVVAVDLLGMTAVGIHGPERLDRARPPCPRIPIGYRGCGHRSSPSGRTRSGRPATAVPARCRPALMRWRLVTVRNRARRTTRRARCGSR